MHGREWFVQPYQRILILKYWRRAYSNSIVHRHNTPDSEQDKEMYSKEHEVWSDCALKKLELQREHGIEDEHWVELYLDYVEDLQGIAIKEALSVLEKPDYDSCKVHFHRRVVAFFHQEKELLRQGEDAWNAAREDEALIMFGRK
jgi:hypothetical protein